MTNLYPSNTHKENIPQRILTWAGNSRLRDKGESLHGKTPASIRAEGVKGLRNRVLITAAATLSIAAVYHIAGEGLDNSPTMKPYIEHEDQSKRSNGIATLPPVQPQTEQPHATSFGPGEISQITGQSTLTVQK